MTNEFNLSDKRLNNQLILDSDKIFDVGYFQYFFREQDVKEFIKLFLKHFAELEMHTEVDYNDIKRVMEELAGETLHDIF